MSTPMYLQSEDVAAYVRAVRGHLDDLVRDEIEELTEGLEADLADALAGRDVTPVALFGAPVDYAAELRSAAGLAPRKMSGARFGVGGPVLALGLRERRDQVQAWLSAQRWWPDVRDFLVTLRPAWWLARAYIAYQFVYQMVATPDHLKWRPDSFLTGLVLAGLVVGSVELGRRAVADQGRWPRRLIRTGNVFAVFLALSSVGALGPALDTYTPNAADTAAASSWSPAPPAGLVNDGYQVVNVFPYDKDGKPLADVQLFDDRGRALTPGAEKYSGINDERVRLIPVVTPDGRSAFNVFPLREQVTAPGYDPDTGLDLPETGTGVVREAARPDATQPPVVPIAVPTPTP